MTNPSHRKFFRHARNPRAILVLAATLALALTLAAAVWPSAVPHLFAMPLPTPAQASSTEKASTGPVELKIGGDVATPLTLSLADLKKMPRKTLSVVMPHDEKAATYEGVLVSDLLRQAGATQGEKLRGPAMATYVLMEAADGYRVIFSLAELDPAILDSNVIVADTVDGAPLTVAQGPLRIVAPNDKRPARWIRMLKSITVVKVDNEPRVTPVSAR
jgi:DMSO/TMAO reductase YedYZ molybdopterin-dependent catalytic subunit